MTTRAHIRLGSIALIGVVLLAGCAGFQSQPEIEQSTVTDTDGTVQQQTPTDETKNTTVHTVDTDTNDDVSTETSEATPATTSSDEPVDETETDGQTATTTATTATDTETMETDMQPDEQGAETPSSSVPTTETQTETETETTTDESSGATETADSDDMYTSLNKSYIYDKYDEDESGTIDLDEVTVVNNNHDYPTSRWEEACSYDTFYEYRAHGGSPSLGDVDGDDGSAMVLPSSKTMTAAQWCDINERAANGENVTDEATWEV